MEFKLSWIFVKNFLFLESPSTPSQSLSYSQIKKKKKKICLLSTEDLLFIAMISLIWNY